MRSGELRTRLIVGIALAVIVVVAILPIDGIAFRCLYSFAAILAIVELESFPKYCYPDFKFFILEAAIVTAGVCAVIFLPHYLLIIGVLSSAATDVFAYTFGKLCGGKFTYGRPFPRISPNKSYEGCIFGIFFQMCTIMLFYSYVPTQSLVEANVVTLVFLTGGIVAISGDLLESYLKRSSGLKDSNDLVKDNRIIGLFEKLLGGEKGHGGFLDRLDSISLTYCIMAIAYLLISA